MLDNDPTIEDHFGVNIMDSVVVVIGKTVQFRLFKMNLMMLFCQKGCEVATLELVMPNTIQPAVGNQPQDSTVKDIAQICSPSMGHTDVAAERKA